jgi:hypothetical protein
VKDPIEFMLSASSDLIDDKKAFNEAKFLGSKILDLTAGQQKGIIFLALYLVICALVDAIDLETRLES